MDLAQMLRQTGANTLGLGDAALTIGKNAVWQPISGLAGLAQLIRSGGDIDAASKTIEDMQAIAGGPSTAEGGQYLEKLGKGIEYVLDPLSKAVDKVGDVSPASGAALAGIGAIIDPSKVGKLSRGLRAAKQATLPGIKALSRGERALMDLDAADRGLRDATEQAHSKHVVVDHRRQPTVGDEFNRLGTTSIPTRVTDEGRALMDEATQRRQQASNAYQAALLRQDAEPQWQRMDELRAGRSPTESLDDTLARERELLSLKSESPIDSPAGLIQEDRGYYNLPEAGRTGVHSNDLPPEAASALNARVNDRQTTRRQLRHLEQAQGIVNGADEAPQLPAWAVNLTEPPTAFGAHAPANAGWWNKALNIDPDAPPQSVGAFLRAVRDQPEAFTYGTMPKNAHSIEDFAKEFGDRAGKRIDVDYEGGSRLDDYDEPYKIEVEKTHGRHELMRDRYGDYKMEDKYHDAGDSPMYDESGNVKKVKVGLDDEGDPIKEKRVAEGGEPWRDEYGDQKQRYIKSEGGEPMRDERGNQKYKEKENPDYDPPSDEDGTLVLRHGRDHINVTDWDSDLPMTEAMSAGKSGALLYQTLLAHASKNGMQMGVAGLTGDNQFRLLSNVLANAARTGTNPRDVTGTLSGKRPRAKGFAPGERLWQAESGEADARIAKYGGNPNAIQFDGRQFLVDGQPISDIGSDLDTFSPGFRTSKVGEKSLMRNAVFKWLEQASPEDAEKAAKGWGQNIGKPLFGLAGTAVGAKTLAELMREEQEPGL